MDEILDSFNKDVHNYEAFTKKMEDLIISLLSNAQINVHLVESRTKSHKSLSDKLERKKEKYKSIQDVTDICGVRIIVYYIDELKKIDTLLRENFQIDEQNSFNTLSSLSENQFGYLSNHYVLSLKSSRSNLPEWKVFKDVKLEVQVRTVLQHAWAAISHELEYKKTYDIPSILKRKLFRLAGLVELADEQFQESRDKHREIETAIKGGKTLENVKIYEELNLNTLKNYFLKGNETLKELTELARKSRFSVSQSSIDRKDDLSEILLISRYLNISTVIDLDKFIKSKLDFAEYYFKAQKKGENTWVVNSFFITLLLLLYFLTDQQLDLYENQRTGTWSRDTWERVRGVIQSIKNEATKEE